MSEPALPAAVPEVPAGPRRVAGAPTSSVRAGDAPSRPAGTRSRSGNAMARTRTAILTASAGLVERQGVRGTTMGEVAAASGVAKATLYNHFRTKDDVLEALVEHEVLRLTAVAAGATTLEEALAAAALGLSSHAALRRVAAEEPAVLGALLRAGTAPAWGLARAGTADVLVQAGLSGEQAQVGAVLRWLVGHALVPASGKEAARGARVLAQGLRSVPVAAPGDAVPAPATTVEVLDPAAPPAVAPEVSGTVEEPGTSAPPAVVPEEPGSAGPPR